jgi:hypothetical protein
MQSDDWDLKSVKLVVRQITLPGSHDAGMYAGDFNSVGNTQDIPIHDQLNEGVRYFDIRPKWSIYDVEAPEYGIFKIHHNVIIDGPNLEEVLNDVAKFMNNPTNKELVVLKFSHYYGFTSGTIYQNMIDLIKVKLGNWLYVSTSGQRIADTPLSSFIGKWGTVLVLCDELYPLDPASGIFTYRDWDSLDPQNGAVTVFDQYSNTTDLSFMISDQSDKFKNFDGKCKNNSASQCDLFLLSWTLTPNYNVWECAKEANNCLKSSINGIRKLNSNGLSINIIYTDYVEFSKSTEVCIAMNGIS